MAVELDLQGLLLQLVSATAISAALAWIATALGKHFIDRNLTSYKLKLEYENAAAIEGMRADASKQRVCEQTRAGRSSACGRSYG